MNMMQMQNFGGVLNNNFPQMLNNQIQYDPMQEMDIQTEVLNITKIKEGLYIGDQIAATNLDVVIQFKLTHMINATGKQIINAWETIGIKYLTVNWQESQTQTLFDPVDEIANKIKDFIEDSLNKGEGLLAYSVRGQNRVCIVILIYLMKKYKWPLNKSLEFLRNRKQDVDIPNYFMDQLKNFEGRMIKRGEGIINIPWSEENLSNPDERLMRNTYVNGLKNEVEKAKIVPSEMKKKNHIAWADFNPIKKQSLEIVNLNKDLFFQKDVKIILNHKKMKPSYSCMKGKRKLNDDYEDKSFDGNRTLSENKGRLKFMEGNMFADNMMNNIKTINPNNQNINYNINNFQNVNQKVDNNIMMRNNFMNNNNENKNVNIINSGNNVPQKINMNMNNNNNRNINYNNSIQPSQQKNILVNTNNNSYSNNFNNNKENIENLPFSYTQMYNFKNNNNINNVEMNKNNTQNITQKKNNINNKNDIRNNNFNNTFSGPQQRPSSITNNTNQSLNNFRGNYNIGSVNSLNPNNLNSYSNIKENIYLNNNNIPNQNNDKGKIIYAEKYEQIVNNNIHNIIINQDSNKQEMKKIKNIKSEKIPNNSNFDSEIGPIPNINFNPGSISMNFTGDNFNYYNNQINNSKTNKTQNIKNPQGLIPKNNENQKNPNINNYFNMNRFDLQNERMNMFNKEQKFKPSDFTNNNLNKNNNFMNYTPIHRQQDFINNYQQNKDNFLDFRNNQIQTKPINNFNPSLMKKNSSSNNNTLKNQNTNNTRKGNLYNRPRSQNGPVKIKNDIIKKPTTPDQINHYKSNMNPNNNLNSKYNNYNSIHKSINYGSKTPTRNDNINNRPSTAPQKDKNHSLYGNNTNNNKFGNIRRSVNNNMSGPTKRLPSPQIHSNNTLNRPIKNNPRYRAPSPVIRSNNSLNSMGIGTIKRNNVNSNHNKMF